MRIAINTRFLLPGKLEGIGLYSREVIRRWVENHPEHEFLFLFDRPYAQEFIFGANVQPLVVPPPARHPVLWYLWFEWSVPYILKRHQADLFFSPDGYCSLRTKVPTLMVTHDLAYRHFPEQVDRWTRRYYEHFIPRFHQRAEGIAAVSEYTRSDIASSFSLDKENIEVAGNGIRPLFAPLSEGAIAEVRDQYAEGAPYFCYVGAIHPRKNVHRLIQAFDKFKSTTGSSLKLLIAGRFAWQTGPVRTAYEEAAARNDIIFLGYAEEADLVRLMGGALALCYVSLFEGFGVPLLEAMYAEVPILTSNVSSLPEVTGSAGLCVDPTSVAAIAEGMLQLEGDARLREQLVAAGRQRRTRFSWDQTADQLWNQLMALKDR
jgi:glycosyltransferase involved in cell wall biosynthesis